MSKKVTLEWVQSGAFYAAFITSQNQVRQARTKLYGYTKQQTQRLLAVVRPAAAGDGLLDEHKGWVVATASFEDTIHFHTRDEAVRHVEAMFALQQD